MREEDDDEVDDVVVMRVNVECYAIFDTSLMHRSKRLRETYSDS
jgi:hypothetical protein